MMAQGGGVDEEFPRNRRLRDSFCLANTKRNEKRNNY